MPLEGVADVARDTDPGYVGTREVERHDRLVLDVVHARQVVDLAVRQPLDVGVEAQVARARGETRQTLDQSVPILRTDLPQQDRGPVAQLGLTAPLLRSEGEGIAVLLPARIVVGQRPLRGRVGYPG